MKKKSGSATSSYMKYPYYDQLLFLKSMNEDRGLTDASIPPPNSDDNSQAINTATTQKKRKSNTQDDLYTEKLLQRFEKIVIEENQEKKTENI